MLSKLFVSVSFMSASLCFVTNAVFAEKASGETSHSGNKFVEVPTSSVKTEQGDWLVRALNYAPASLTPYRAPSSAASAVQSYIFEPLVKKNLNTNKWEGWLADSWTVSEDGLKYVFQLRSNVNFSDGEPLSAEDVVFTYQFLMDEKIDLPGPKSYLKRLQKVEVINQIQVSFEFSEPYFQALQLVSNLPILPQHFYGKFLKNPEDFNSSTSEVLGSGPYRLPTNGSWAPDAGAVELNRNERYWGQSGTFDKLIWKIIKNKSAKLIAFRNGEIDVYEADPAAYRDLLEDKHIQATSNNFEFMRPKQGYTYIGWNPVFKGKKTPFADKRVRQAMTYLTNRDDVVDVAYRGYADIVMSPFRPESTQHNMELVPRKYNLEKAQALLAQAGYLDRDGNGVIENESGEPFSFKFSYASSRDDGSKIALLLRDLYAQAGIAVQLDPQESRVLHGTMMDTKNYQALTSGWSGALEMDIYYMFHSDHAGPKGYNFIGFKHSEMDRLIDETRVTVNEDERMDLWREAEKILYDEQPYTFLVRRKSLLFVNNRIKNLKVTPAGLNLNALPLEVYVPRALQKY